MKVEEFNDLSSILGRLFSEVNSAHERIGRLAGAIKLLDAQVNKVEAKINPPQKLDPNGKIEKITKKVEK